MPTEDGLPLCAIEKCDEKTITSPSRDDPAASAPEPEQACGSQNPSLRVPSYYLQTRPQSAVSLAQSLDLGNLLFLPAKAYQPPGTHHRGPSPTRPESETIPPVSPPPGLNITMDGERRFSTLSLEDAGRLLATNPWQIERSRRSMLQNGRLVASSISAREKPLPPLPLETYEDVSVESSKQTTTENTRVRDNSMELPVRGIPVEWLRQATTSRSEEQRSLHDMPRTTREIISSAEGPPEGKPDLHRVSTIPNWVKDWRRSRAENSRHADSFEVLPTCRESHLPAFVRPDIRPPDARSRTFLQVLGGFFVMLNTFGLLQSYGVFQIFYASLFLPNEAPLKTATIGSSQMFSLLTTAFAAGLLEDITPFRAVLFGGCMILVISILINSVCSLWWHLFLVQGICTGIGMGLIFGAGFANLCSSVSTGRYGAVAAASCGAGVGGMIYTAMAEKLLTGGGYGWAFRAMALISFVTLVSACITLREPERERPKVKLSIDWTILHDIPFLLLLAGLFLTFLGLFTGFFYAIDWSSQLPTLAPLLLHQKGPHSLPSNLLIITNAFTIPSALLILPVVAPHLGALNTLIPTTLLTSFVLFLWIGATSTTGIVMLTCAYGVCAGAVLSLFLLAVGELMTAATRTAHFYLLRGQWVEKVEVGIWMGVLYAGSERWTIACREDARCRLAVLLGTVAVASLVGMPLAGTMVEDKVGAQAFAGTCVLLGGGFFVGARVAKVGWTGVKV